MMSPVYFPLPERNLKNEKESANEVFRYSAEYEPVTMKVVVSVILQIERMLHFL